VSTSNTIQSTIAPAESARRFAVARAEHSGEMEGLHVDPATRADGEEYAAGRIDSDEFLEPGRCRRWLAVGLATRPGRRPRCRLPGCCGAPRLRPDAGRVRPGRLTGRRCGRSDVGAGPARASQLEVGRPGDGCLAPGGDGSPRAPEAYVASAYRPGRDQDPDLGR